jgi:hypothetical protein
MDAKLQLFAVLGSVALLLTILELVRRRRLLERYAVLWLFCAAVLLALSVWSNLLEGLADLLGIVTPANALFAIAFGFVALLLLHFSLAVSRLADQSKVLAQRLAIAQSRIAELEKEEADPASDPVEPETALPLREGGRFVRRGDRVST